MRTTLLLVLLVGWGCGGGRDDESGPGPATSSRPVLEEFAAILNRNVPEFRETIDRKGFRVVDGQPVRFFVFNLADTTNSFPRDLDPAKDTQLPFALNEQGIFHFAPIWLEYSISHIGVVENDQLRVFSFVNCEGRGESIRDVVEYVSGLGSYDSAVIARVQDYRSYGFYVLYDYEDPSDPSYVKCK